MNNVLVIIPTYNEKENLDNVIKRVRAQSIPVDILFVDDNSPDGTADLIRAYMKDDPTIHLIEREGKMGLGTAYVAGFKYALSKSYQYIMEMDADLSHDPAEIPNFYKAANDADLILGSRYITGVNVINWPLKRLLLSYFANIYAKTILGVQIKDLTGGFKLFKREVLERINLDGIKSNGYSFQIEMTYRAICMGFDVKEISIIFYDRTAGNSKMSQGIVKEAVFLVWRLKIRHLLGQL